MAKKAADKYIKDINEVKEVKEPTKKATVIGGSLNIRSGKTTEDNNIVGVLPDGAQVEVLKEGKLWCEIKGGYVMRQFLNIE